MQIDQQPFCGQATAVEPTRARSIYRRYVPAHAIEAQCRRQGLSWLSSRERAELSNWRDRRRQRAWLWGRMVGKQLIFAKLQVDSELAKIEILSGDGLGRPRIWCDGIEQPWSLSISHTGHGVLAAVCGQERISVGVDITPCEGLSEGFIRTWFTPDETAWLRQTAPPAGAYFLWAAKEALYKACNRGESFDPRQVEVLPQGGCRYRRVLLQDCRLQSWHIDGQVAALASIGHRTDGRIEPTTTNNDFRFTLSNLTGGNL